MQDLRDSIDPNISQRIIQSSILDDLGVPHGFSTRKGGISPAPFDSLNFGNPGDLEAHKRDGRENIQRNWNLLLEAIELALVSSSRVNQACARTIREVHQVHGNQVHIIARSQHPLEADTPADSSSIKADAMVTDDPRVILGVRVADCTPVLIASEDGKVVSAAHAGWRGVIEGVVIRAMDEMALLGARRSGLRMAIGPCIGPRAFQVQGDVAQQFVARFGEGSRVVMPDPSHSDRFLIDLQRALSLQATGTGVLASHVHILRRCTFDEPEWFFSHRRDQGLTGRMVGVIGVRE